MTSYLYFCLQNCIQKEKPPHGAHRSMLPRSGWLHHLPRPCPSYAQGAQGNRNRSIGGTMDAKQLEKMMGFAPGELEKAAAAYEKDEWPKGHTVKLGRPPISDEPSVVLSARVGESVLEAFTQRQSVMGRHAQSGSGSSLPLTQGLPSPPPNPNVYVSIQSRLFSTSLGADVQLLQHSRWGRT